VTSRRSDVARFIPIVNEVCNGAHAEMIEQRDDHDCKKRKNILTSKHVVGRQ
jgi:hypothetical protein